MTTPVSPKPKQPFAFQAALIGIWAPIIAIILGLTTQETMRESPWSALIIGGVNSLFILTGFIMSLIALISIHKYGRKDLLVRGIVGVGLNGLFILAGISLIWYGGLSNRTADRMIGNWEYRDSSRGTTELLELHKDKTFHLGMTGKYVLDVSGEWKVGKQSNTENIVLVMHVSDFKDGSENITGKDLVVAVDQLNPEILQLRDENKTKIYLRR